MSVTVGTDWALAVLLLTARLVPVFVFAPPFSLLNVPAPVRLLLVLGLAACLVQLPGARLPLAGLSVGEFMAVLLSEVMLGLGFSFALNAAFAALYFAGRLLDIQAGLGLAAVVDPATRTHAPLVGTMFVFAAGSMFFAVNGHHELLSAVAASLETMPVGSVAQGWDVGAVVAHFGIVFSFGLLAAGAAMIALFLTDVTIAFMSRSLPQMNILVLGFQAKTLVLITTLAAVSGLMAPLFLRLFSRALSFAGAAAR